MSKTPAGNIALGGVLAAAALVIMCLGGLIPIATYVCPMLCCLTAALVLRTCGRRLGWAWYGAVAILSLLLGPDKEAAVIFLLLGYYPMVKPVLEKSPLQVLWKLLLFNGAIGIAYTALYRLMGMAELAEEYAFMGLWGLAVMLLLGNLLFFLLDRLLSRLMYKR